MASSVSAVSPVVGPTLRQRTFALTRAWQVVALLVLACGVLLFVGETWLLTAQRPTVRLAADSREASVLLDGFHATERDARGRYRWSEGTSRLVFPQISAGIPLILGLELGAPPVQLKTPPVTLTYANGLAASFASDDRARRYLVLVPPRALRNGMLTADLQSSSVTVPPDPRSVGVRFEAATLAPTRTAVLWPSLWLVGVQVLVLGLVAVLVRRFVKNLAVVASVTLLATLALALVGYLLPLLIYLYSVRLVGAGVCLVALTWALLPAATRAFRIFAPPASVRALWGVALLGCALRLSGVLYPAFAAHDLALNVDRFTKTANGTLLVLNHSLEFGHGVTIYPPASYIALLPGVLLGLSPALVVATGIALLDGFAALAVGLLAHALGMRPRGARFAALLYASAPISLAALYFGHTAQAFGQAMTVPIALALLLAIRRADVRPWLAAATLLLVALLSHIGVTILAVMWLGLVWLLLLVQRRVTWGARWRFALVLAIACGLAVALIYADVVSSHIEQTRAIGEDAVSDGYEPSYWLIAQGFLIAWQSLGLLLLPFGALLLARRRLPQGGGALIGGWLLAVGLFLGVELVVGLQVRYIYFLAPLACVLIGLILDRLAARGRSASWVAWTILLFLVLNSSTTWYAGTFYGARISMVSLVR